MPINAYTGLMGSGKSYEIMISVVIPAIRAGRRVVTNIEGISGELVRAYCITKYKADPAKLGQVLHVQKERIWAADFFPTEDKGTSASLVQGGDMVVIDEAALIWPIGDKDRPLSKEHKEFFLKHRHYTHPETGTACDLAFAVQDIRHVARTLSAVVEMHFRTKKLKALGLNKSYVVEWCEGSKLDNKTSLGTDRRRYKPEIFPLYQSYVGGAGKEKQIDKRQNIFGPKFIVIGSLAVACAVYGLFNTRSFFSPKAEAAQAAAPPMAGPSGATGAPASSPAPAPAAPRVARIPAFSPTWRLAGYVLRKGRRMVVLVNEAGVMRYEDPSLCVMLDGAPAVCEVEGYRVTAFTGPRTGPGNQPTPAALAAPVAAVGSSR